VQSSRCAVILTPLFATKIYVNTIARRVASVNLSVNDAPKCLEAVA